MNKRVRTAFLALTVLAILLVATIARAGSSTHHNLFWQVLSGGGAPAASGSGKVSLNGSLGQAAIGVSTSTGRDTVLRAGYWPGTAESGWEILFPLVVNSY